MVSEITTKYATPEVSTIQRESLSPNTHNNKFQQLDRKIDAITGRLDKLDIGNNKFSSVGIYLLRVTE